MPDDLRRPPKDGGDDLPHPGARDNLLDVETQSVLMVIRLGTARDTVARDQDTAADNAELVRNLVPTCSECQLPMGLAAQILGAT